MVADGVFAPAHVLDIAEVVSGLTGGFRQPPGY